MENDLTELRKYYDAHLAVIEFEEIEHVPDSFMSEEIAIQENCLCISHGFFNKYYGKLMEELQLKRKGSAIEGQWICELLLIMNGENDKAWNTKKGWLEAGELNIKRELQFNAAVCYKNKKSSSYYDYRMKLYQQLVKNPISNEQIIQIYHSENALIRKILERFFRNYYCWMYRNRLFELFLPLIGRPLIEIQKQFLHKYIDVHPNDYSAYSRLIALHRKYGIDVQEESAWLQDLNSFCVLAFENGESYRHIDTYRKYLKIFTKKLQSSEH